jgi:CHASE2 domain-containing sensor protein
VVAYRDKKGRIYVTTSLGVVLAVVGGIVGATVGVASGGWAIPATIPGAALGLLVGSGAGYILGDKAVDKPRCPKCRKAIDMAV